MPTLFPTGPVMVSALADCFLHLKPIRRARLTHRPDDGGSKVLWNVGKLLPDYTALQPRRQPSSYSPPSEPQILLSKPLWGGYSSLRWEIRNPSDQESQATLLPIFPTVMQVPRSRYQGAFPCFLQFHHYIHSQAAKRICRRTSFSLLRECIYHTRRELD
jgi:hypothetical protein